MEDNVLIFINKTNPSTEIQGAITPPTNHLASKCHHSPTCILIVSCVVVNPQVCHAICQPLRLMSVNNPCDQQSIDGKTNCFIFIYRLTFTLVRGSWHALRWDLRALRLPRMFRQMWHPRSLNILSHSAFGNGPAYEKLSKWRKINKSATTKGYLWVYWSIEQACMLWVIKMDTYKVLPEGFKWSTMFPADTTHGFMVRMVRGPHVFHQVLHPVELSVACCTLVPAIKL